MPLFAQAESVRQQPRGGSAASVAPERDTRIGGGSLRQRCARCHDADGTGKAARGNFAEIPDFTNHRWQASRSDAQLLASILDGKGSHMPAYRDKLSDKEARQLVVQVRGLDPTPATMRAATAPDDFDRRFEELQQELQDLKKQFRDLSTTPRKP